MMTMNTLKAGAPSVRLDLENFPLTRRSRNLTRFCRHTDFDTLDAAFATDLAFRDAGSPLLILKSPHTLPGPDEAFIVHHVDARLLFSKLLGLEVKFPQQPAASAPARQLYNSASYFRSHIDERFHWTAPYGVPTPPVAGSCTMFYEDDGRLLAAYEMRNVSFAHLEMQLRFISRPQLGSPGKFIIRNNGFEVSDRQRVNEEYNAHAFLRLLGIPAKFTGNTTELTSGWVERSLAGGETLRFTAEVTVSFGPMPKIRSTSVKPNKTLLRRVTEAEAAYASLPPLPARFARHETVVLRAVGTIRTLRCTLPDMQGRGRLAVARGKCGVHALGWWDSPFPLLALAHMGDTATAADMIRLLVGAILEDGTQPGMMRAIGYDYQDQQPNVAMGVVNYLHLRPDPGLMRDSYGPLARYVRHWLREHDADKDGLIDAWNGFLGWDDSVRWHENFPIAPKAGQGWNRDLGPSCNRFINVDTNVHLLLECRALAFMAEALGHPAEAADWQTESNRLAKLIQETLWNPEEGIYQDRSIDGRFTGLTTAASFMPLYAGIVPPERAAAMARILLDPRRFWSPLPFPTLDMMHPSFRSGGFLFVPPKHPGALVHQSYWNGRAWPCCSYWMVGALWQVGLHAEADEAADRILEGLSRHETLNENYDPLTGYPAGHPEFPWTAGVVIALALREYAKDPVSGGPR